jgi:hypothetical protein
LNGLLGVAFVNLPELEIKPVASGYHHGGGDQSGKDIHHIVIATINRRKAEEDRDGQVEVADGAQVTE